MEIGKEIGIVIVATNAYFILGIRFMRKFAYYYRGDRNVKFYFYSDTDPSDYISDNIKIEYRHTEHKTWREGTNSKFTNILALEDCSSDYLYYFDADTDIDKTFTDEWFLGDTVAGEHYGNRSFLSNGKGMDRNGKSGAYIPTDCPLPYTYYYGAFFGGKRSCVMEYCKILKERQDADHARGYEAPVNDESYINWYFHFNVPSLTVKTEQFAFLISDKGGLGDTRRTNLDISKLKKQILENKENLFELKNNKITWK